MAHYFCKLVPPRATFPADITAQERELMDAHIAYWRPHLDMRRVFAMGPVLDPAGVYGMAVVEAAGLEALHALQAADPIIAASRGFHYVNHQMAGLSVPPGEPLAPVSSISP